MVHLWNLPEFIMIINSNIKTSERTLCKEVGWEKSYVYRVISSGVIGRGKAPLRAENGVSPLQLSCAHNVARSVAEDREDLRL